MRGACPTAISSVHKWRGAAYPPSVAAGSLGFHGDPADAWKVRGSEMRDSPHRHRYLMVRDSEMGHSPHKHRCLRVRGSEMGTVLSSTRLVLLLKPGLGVERWGIVITSTRLVVLLRGRKTELDKE